MVQCRALGGVNLVGGTVVGLQGRMEMRLGISGFVPEISGTSCLVMGGMRWGD